MRYSRENNDNYEIFINNDKNRNEQFFLFTYFSNVDIFMQIYK